MCPSFSLLSTSLFFKSYITIVRSREAVAMQRGAIISMMSVILSLCNLIGSPTCGMLTFGEMFHCLIKLSVPAVIQTLWRGKYQIFVWRQGRTPFSGIERKYWCLPRASTKRWSLKSVQAAAKIERVPCGPKLNVCNDMSWYAIDSTFPYFLIKSSSSESSKRKRQWEWKEFPTEFSYLIFLEFPELVSLFSF